MKTVFEWGEIVPEMLVQQLCGVAGADPAVVGDRVSDSVALIFASLGERPIVEGAVDAARQQELSRALLSRALERTLGQASVPRLSGGSIVVGPDDLPADEEYVPHPRVLLNIATAEELEPLPGIGGVIAGRIVEERWSNGPFRSIEALIERIHGLGPGAQHRLQTCLSFASPIRAQSALDLKALSSLEAKMAAVIRLVDEPTPGDTLLAALDMVQGTCASSRLQLPANARLLDLPQAPPAGVDASFVGVLEGAEYYYRLPEIFGEAQTSIHVMIFHAVLPSETHPTKALLDALVAAKQRSVNVRVLLDQDRETDPYRSTIINTPAKAYLDAAGVTCRFDTRDRLLHSKLAIVDDRTVVIGSHNWSAGSFFHFDDLSLLVRSSLYGAQMLERFDAAWTAAAGAHPDN